MKTKIKTIDYLMAMAMIVIMLGCAGYNSTHTRGPDGNDGWFTIDCNLDNCTTLADKLCPNGYLKANKWTVVEKHVEHASAVQNNNQLFLRCK